MPEKKMVTINNDVDMENGGNKNPKVDVKTPLMVLNETRPGVKFELVSESGEVHARQFTMGVRVDGNLYEGTGRTKRLARTRAAHNAVKSLFGIDFTNSDDGEVLLTLSSKKKRAQYKQLVKEQGVPTYGAPTITLNVIYGDSVKYKILSQLTDNFKVSLNIEGTIIEGRGKTLKEAKTIAHEKGMTFLKEMGLYDQRVKELKQRIAAKRDKKIEYFKQRKLEKASEKAMETNVEQPPVLQVKNEVPLNTPNTAGKKKSKAKGTKL